MINNNNPKKSIHEVVLRGFLRGGLRVGFGMVNDIKEIQFENK